MGHGVVQVRFSRFTCVKGILPELHIGASRSINLHISLKVDVASDIGPAFVLVELGNSDGSKDANDCNYN